MGTLEDARGGLAAGSVADRSAAMREVARTGDWSDAAGLFALAIGDKSHAIRLYAAAALIRIAARSPRDRDRDEALLAWVGGIDPERNPAVLSLLAFVDDDRSLDRIGRLLRDPRNGVRAGALVALRRLALAPEERPVGARVSEWLAHPKIPPDVAFELVRLVGEVGLAECAGQLAGAASFGPKHLDAATVAVRRLDDRARGDAFLGVFQSDGTRLFDDEPADEDPSWLVVGTAAAALNGAPAPWTPGSPPRLGASDVRVVFGPPPGAPDERVRVLQIGGRAWWAVAPKDLAKALDEDPEQFRSIPEGVPDPVADTDAAPLPRARALWAWRTGAADVARDALVELAGRGRAPGATMLWLARIHEDLGELDAARAAATSFLDKAKRGPERDRAAALLSRLDR